MHRNPISDKPVGPTHRRGTTLLEMVATMSVLLVLAVAAVRMLSTVSEIGIATADDGRRRSEASRLADSFRQDIRAADTVQADQWPVEISHDDLEIRYQYDPAESAVDRTIWRDSDRIATDRFRLPIKCDPQLESDPDRIRLSLARGVGVSWIVEVNRP
ncbi:hypothetical protein K227x_24340 [Rubripirellula lacrimiformis]|uniref:Prepilin-type N-terminal cleavage/methylation domain-containing protein n=1 Tax=Rubripirellula lacrimiformis TaxID=1930273 RepID=A0A517NAK3_9BACT|nr:prepilin-type N-terminal cleavage/methylation domain-containing protein [Rubripirellula lacrimiformis]QDT04048.1 hypothetical protein K227x_24340 [Rubripirellula lacrimiformis]